MISQPNLWNENKYGGFLLNTINHKDLVRGSEHHSHHLNRNKKNFYDSVNYLNSLKFKVNTDFLNYLENDGTFILEHYKNTKG